MSKAKEENVLNTSHEVKQVRTHYSFGLIMTDRQTILLPPNPKPVTVVTIGGNCVLIIEGDVITPDGSQQRTKGDVLMYAIGEKIKPVEHLYLGHFTRGDGQQFFVYATQNIPEIIEGKI